MIITNVKLKIDEAEYDLLGFSYKFQRDVDAKNRPCSVYYGGDIIVEMESSNDNVILRKMLLKNVSPVRGSIEVFGGADEQCLRRIEFEEAYVYSHGEQMQYGSQPPITTIAISPMRFDIDRKVFLDRRWPETTGHWTIVKREDAKYAKIEAEEDKSIVEIYWTYGENKVRLNNKSRHYTDMNLHVVTKGYNKGDIITVLIESTDNIPVTDQSTALKVTGQVNGKGEMIIENVLKRYMLNL